MDNKDGGQLRRRCGTGVLAEGPNEVAADVAVAVRRRNRFVARLDPLVVLTNLLAERVVRHQPLDDRGRSQTGHRELRHAIEEVAARDLAVNILRVQLDGLCRDFRFLRRRTGLRAWGRSTSRLRPPGWSTGC